jgi:hypothetical protein
MECQPPAGAYSCSFTAMAPPANVMLVADAAAALP